MSRLCFPTYERAADGEIAAGKDLVEWTSEGEGKDFFEYPSRGKDPR